MGVVASEWERADVLRLSSKPQAVCRSWYPRPLHPPSSTGSRANAARFVWGSRSRSGSVREPGLVRVFVMFLLGVSLSSPFSEMVTVFVRVQRLPVKPETGNRGRRATYSGREGKGGEGHPLLYTCARLLYTYHEARPRVV